MVKDKKQPTRKSPGTKTYSGKQKLIFRIIMILLPIVFFVFLELLLRLFQYGDNLSLFIRHPDAGYKSYKVVNPVIGKKYFNRFEYTSPAKDIFLKKKPKDCFRIFVMGSSTVAGFPYDRNLMFSRILEERLNDAYPGKKIEMINTSITAINSFTLDDFMSQVLKEDPDAILIYAGHNEFYGALGVGSNESFVHNRILVRTHFKLMNLRTYQLIKNFISKVNGGIVNAKSAKEKRGTLMTRIVNKAEITYDSEDYNKGIRYFEENLNSMMKKAGKKDIPIFISDLVSNVKDIKPFKSTGSEGEFSADEYFKNAVQLEKEGNYEKALKNYNLARDYDCVRFRASSDVNRIIRETAEKYKAYFVPTLELFEAGSPHGIIGDNLLVEHVHPNISGAFLMAESFYKSIVKSGIISERVDEYSVKPYDYYVNSYGYSVLDYLLGYHRTTNLKHYWPFVDETKAFIDYRTTYKPKSYIDSLAFYIMVSDELSAQDAHLELASHYEKMNDLLNAFREYKSIIKINPYISQPYRKAADFLLYMNDPTQALKYYKKSLEFEPTFYACFRAGEICMIKNDYESAVHFFTQASEISEKERYKALENLYIAYIYKRDKENSVKIMDELKRISPGAKPEIPAKSYRLISYIPLQVKVYFDSARTKLAASDYNGAVKSLMASLRINDSPVTNRYLSELFFNLKEYQRAIFHAKKAYADFKFDPKFLHFLIVNSVALNDRNAAEEYFSQLKEVEPAYPEIPKIQSFINNPAGTNP